MKTAIKKILLAGILASRLVNYQSVTFAAEDDNAVGNGDDYVELNGLRGTYDKIKRQGLFAGVCFDF